MKDFCEGVLGRSAVKECCEGMLWRKSCGGVLW